MHLATLLDWKPEQVKEAIDFAIEIKANPGKYASAMRNKTLAMLFQKTSTRTRMSFEAGATQLGGHAIYLDWRTTNLTLGALADEAKCMARYSDIIMARVYKHDDIQTICKASAVPVINGLCNLFHPCQALADYLTVREHRGKLQGTKLAYLGDGNNVCNSLIIAGAKLGVQVSVATPASYKPLEKAEELGKKQGTYSWAESPQEAAKNADVVYTDTWVSMGDEAEKKKRVKAFPPYQVNAELMKLAKPDAVFMHCLPAHRNSEVSDEVLDSKQSIVFDQAENRMHTQKAVMLLLLNKWK